MHLGLWNAARRYWLPAAVVVVLGVGWWGFLDVFPGRPLRALYAAVRLFGVNLDVPDAVAVPPQLWVAAVLAPLLTAGSVAVLLRDRLQGVGTWLFARPEVVVVGAGDRAEAMVRAHGTPRRVVVVDPDRERVGVLRELGAWTVVGDGISRRSLGRARVDRAGTVVVATGADRRNCEVTAAVLTRTGRAHVFVELAEAGLARTLERRDAAGEARTTPFSGLALAASDVLDELGRPGGQLLRPEGADAPAFALFGTGPLVEAMVLELQQRRRVRVLRDGRDAGPPPRIALFGPDATRQQALVARLVGTELDAELTAFTVALDQAAELDAETSRRLLDLRPLRAVMVLVPDDLAGAAVAGAVRRRLGREVVLVTEAPASPFAQRLVAAGTVRAFRVPELAYPPARLARHRTHERLARARHEVEPGQTTRWEQLPEAVRAAHRDAATELLTRSPAARFLRVDTFHPIGPPEIPIAEALGIVRPAALTRAGIGLDLAAPGALHTAADLMLSRGDRAAFEAWCEAARRETDPKVLLDWSERLASFSSGTDRDDVRTLLRLRRAVLGDVHALDGEPVAVPRTQLSGEVVLVIGGSAGGTDGADGTAEEAPEELRALLAAAFDRPAYPGTIVAPPGDGGVTRLLRAVAPGVAVLGPDATGARGRHLGLWTELLRAGRTAAQTRVLALPGDEDARLQVVVARALGARVAWLPVDGAGIARRLVRGADGIVELPVDPMTVRAFLRPSTWTGSGRTRLASAMHDRYVERHRSVKPAGDPALQPFARLSPALRDSNLSAVDDVPAKLAAASLRLCPLAEAPRPGQWPEGTDLDVLAEMEHGRWIVERLLSGWASGARDPGRLLSPHLRPWAQLPDDVRAWDLDLVRDLPVVLAAVGLGIAPQR